MANEALDVAAARRAERLRETAPAACITSQLRVCGEVFSLAFGRYVLTFP